MKKSTILALCLGMLVTFLAVGVDWAGGFVSWERQSIDYRFRTVPRPAQPMSDEIVHVDIDDSALDRFGEWPWDRATLGSMIDELRKAGAKTIALDLTFSGRRQQDYSEGARGEPDEDSAADEIWWSNDDRAFAIAMRKAQCVLALDTHAGALHDEIWTSDKGRADLRALLDVLAENIELDPATAARKAKLSPSRIRRFQSQPLEFKRQAAWQVLLASPEIESFDEFQRLVVPGLSENVRFYPERPILESIWTQARAWSHVQDHLMPGDSAGTYKDKAPLEIFARSAGSFGFVTVKGQEHADGFVREMRMKLPAPGGFGLQFGAAAVTHHVGLKVADVEVTDESITIGSTKLPLRDGKLWLNWPTSETTPRWFGLLRQHEEDPTSAGHLSIRELVELALARKTVAETHRKINEVSALILNERDVVAVSTRFTDPLRPEVLAETRDAAEFFLEIDPGSAFDPSEAATIRQTIQDDEQLSASDKEAELKLFDLYTRWFELAGAHQSGDSTAGEALARQTIEVLARNEPRQADPVAEAGAEVRRMLPSGKRPAAADTAASSDHLDNCELRRDLDLALEDARSRMGSAELKLKSEIGGKLVLVGWTGTGTVADFVPTAVGSQTPGVIVHAVIANMVLSGAALDFPPQWQVSSIVLLFGLLCTLIAARFAAVNSALLAGASLAAYIGIAGVWLFRSNDVILPMVAPIIAGTLSWVACTALQAAISQRERARITRQFKRVSAQLVDHLVNNPGAVSMTGEEREMTVMFGDLANFTTVSEKLGGQTTVSTLNRYLRALATVLIDHDAYLNKFLGDGLMAFWSAFAVEPRQASKACNAALKCHAELQRLNDDKAYEHIPKLGLRLGIATGKVVVGDCGAPPELNDYTVIGDAVNLSSRLESANKQFGTEILIDGRTQQQIGDVPVALRPLGKVVVVGQSVPVAVFEVMPQDTPPELIELSERAVNAYAKGSFDEASAAFDELDERFGKTKITDLYRRAIANADGEFDGALHLSEK